MNAFEKSTQKAAADTVAAAEKYLFERLQELGVPARVAKAKPSRITKIDFPDRKEYCEYLLDAGTPQEIFLFCEIVEIIFRDGKFVVAQELSSERQTPDNYHRHVRGNQ